MFKIIKSEQPLLAQLKAKLKAPWYMADLEEIKKILLDIKHDLERNQTDIISRLKVRQYSRSTLSGYKNYIILLYVW